MNSSKTSRANIEVTAADLLRRPEGSITRAGFELNQQVALRYMAAWLSGNGCVPIFNEKLGLALMEDAATAEISRVQNWRWIKGGARFEDGAATTADLFRQIQAADLAKLRQQLGEAAFANGKFQEAADLLERQVTAAKLAPFMTLEAYDLLEPSAATARVRQKA
jgi:malate synthase